jgi:hypothetical protein
MTEKVFLIEFEGVSIADANRYAKELEPLLRQATNQANVKTGQKDKNSQDFGATLIIGVLSAPAIIKLSEKLGDWLPKRNAKITIKRKDGEVVAENIKSKDAAMLANKWLEKFEQEN